MKITIELDTIDGDSAELAAIFNALAGRGEATVSGPRFAAEPETLEPRTFIHDGGALSDSLIADEAARVASDVPPPPPVVDQAAPAPYVPAGPLDSKGTPWDARIHADSKGTNADGQYKRRKGVDAATYDRIGAELRAATARPIDPAATALPTPDATAAADVPPPPPPPAPADGPPAADTAIPPPPTAAGGITAQAILADMGRRGLTFEQNGELAKSVGLAGVQDILSAPADKLQELANMVVLVHGPAA